MKTSPSAQLLGFLDLELLVQWPEARGRAATSTVTPTARTKPPLADVSRFPYPNGGGQGGGERLNLRAKGRFTLTLPSPSRERGRPANRCAHGNGFPRSKIIFAAAIPPGEVRAIRDDCYARGVSARAALMERAGWPAIPYDGQLLVSH